MSRILCVLCIKSAFLLLLLFLSLPTHLPVSLSKDSKFVKTFSLAFFPPRFLFRFRKNPLHTVVRIYTGRRNELVYKNLYRIARNQVGEFRHMESNFSYGGKKNWNILSRVIPFFSFNAQFNSNALEEISFFVFFFFLFFYWQKFWLRSESYLEIEHVDKFTELEFTGILLKAFKAGQIYFSFSH